MESDFKHRTSITFTEVIEAREFNENDLRDGILSGKLVPSYFIDGQVSEYLCHHANDWKRIDWKRTGAEFKKELMFLVKPRVTGSLDCDFEFCADVPDVSANECVVYQFSTLGGDGVVQNRKTLAEVLRNGEVMQAELARFKLACYQQAQQSSVQNNLPKWPWGEYQTELLGHLQAAAVKFWIYYDPNDPTTAPTNEKVSEWLHTDRKLSKKMASSIATMLRADKLPTGPRK